MVGQLQTDKAEQLRVLDKEGDDCLAELGNGAGVCWTLGAEEGELDLGMVSVPVSSRVVSQGCCWGERRPPKRQGESHAVRSVLSGDVPADDVESAQKVVHVAVEEDGVAGSRAGGRAAVERGGGVRRGVLDVLDEGPDDVRHVPGLFDEVVRDGVVDEDEGLFLVLVLAPETGAGGWSGGRRVRRVRRCWRWRQPHRAQILREREYLRAVGVGGGSCVGVAVVGGHWLRCGRRVSSCPVSCVQERERQSGRSMALEVVKRRLRAKKKRPSQLQRTAVLVINTFILGAVFERAVGGGRGGGRCCCDGRRDGRVCLGRRTGCPGPLLDLDDAFDVGPCLRRDGLAGAPGDDLWLGLLCDGRRSFRECWRRGSGDVWGDCGGGRGRRRRRRRVLRLVLRLSLCVPVLWSGGSSVWGVLPRHEGEHPREEGRRVDSEPSVDPRDGVFHDGEEHPVGDADDGAQHKRHGDVLVEHDGELCEQLRSVVEAQQAQRRSEHPYGQRAEGEDVDLREEPERRHEDGC